MYLILVCVCVCVYVCVCVSSGVSKGALDMLTKMMGLELGPYKVNVTASRLWLYKL